MEKNDLTSREKKALQFLTGLDASLNIFDGDLEGRLRTIPDGWRKYRVARSMISRIMRPLYESLPIETRIYLRNMQANEELTIRPKHVAGVRNDHTFVPDDVLEVLVETSMRAECAMCLKTDSEVRKCKLRKGLMLILPPAETKHSTRCPYLDFVINND